MNCFVLLEASTIKTYFFYQTKCWKKIKITFSDCLDEFAVQGLFGFLSENLNFESLQDELNQRKLLSEKETKDYIYHAPGKHFRGGKIIKLMIKKRRCKDFVACLQENSHHSHICEKILEVKENQQLVKEGNLIKGESMCTRHFLQNEKLPSKTIRGLT